MWPTKLGGEGYRIRQPVGALSSDPISIKRLFLRRVKGKLRSTQIIPEIKSERKYPSSTYCAYFPAPRQAENRVQPRLFFVMNEVKGLKQKTPETTVPGAKSPLFFNYSTKPHPRQAENRVQLILFSNTNDFNDLILRLFTRHHAMLKPDSNMPSG